MFGYFFKATSAEHLTGDSNAPSPGNKAFTPDELYELRREERRCLVGLFGYVCNVEKYLPHHPGLEKSIRGLQGHDISDLFTGNDPNHKSLNKERVIKTLEKAGCEIVGTLRPG